MIQDTSKPVINNLASLDQTIIGVASQHSYQDERDKLQILKLLQAVDSITEEVLGTDAFSTSERLQKGYGQLQKAEATSVFEKGIGRLQEVRKEIWTELTAREEGNDG